MKSMNELELTDYKESLEKDGWTMSPNGDSAYRMLQISPANDWWCLIEDGNLIECPVVSFALCEVVDIDSYNDGRDSDVYKAREVLPVLQNFAADADGTLCMPYITKFSADLGTVIRTYLGKGQHGYKGEEEIRHTCDY